MAYPFGGIPLGVLRQVLLAHFSIEEMETDEPVHTLDGPKQESFWYNRPKNRMVEVPGSANEDRVSTERVRHIARRLDVDHPTLLGYCMVAENNSEA